MNSKIVVYTRDFSEKGCKVVKTPMYTGFATCRRLSEVVKRLSEYRGYLIASPIVAFASLKTLASQVTAYQCGI